MKDSGEEYREIGFEPSIAGGTNPSPKVWSFFLHWCHGVKYVANDNPIHMIISTLTRQRHDPGLKFPHKWGFLFVLNPPFESS